MNRTLTATDGFAWRAAQGGAMLLHFGAKGFTARDAVSGTELWQTDY